jgi:hypothetical protein
MTVQQTLATDLEPVLLRHLRELASSIDGVVLLKQCHKLRPELVVALGSFRRRSGLGFVVGRGGDLKPFQDWLDSPAKPTGCFLPVGFDVGDYFCDRRSSSAPKKADAD